VIGALAIVGGWALAWPAHATLGGVYSSVESDRTHMVARMRSASAATYAVHTLTLPNQGEVREFTRSDGIVFAVAWKGPGRPDLRQLLGQQHFDTFQADNVPPQGRRTRRPLGVNRPDLIVHSAGHSGAFWGFAYLPQQTPSGFSTSELK
jgi:hypothetical protein